MNVKDKIENTLYSFAKTVEEQEGKIDDQSIEMLIEALNSAYGEIYKLEEDLQDQETLAYTYLERYTWLRSHITPRQLADNLDIDWEPFPPTATWADYTKRIDTYVDSGIIAEAEKSYLYRRIGGIDG